MVESVVKENWKIIKDFESYSISTLGNVKNNETNVIIKPYLTNMGYWRVALWKENKSKKFYIHRLIALHFISNPYNKPQINHIDCNPLNNSISNLEWTTQSENIVHSAKLGRIKGNTKTPILCHLLNGEFVGEYESQLKASKELNCIQPLIYKCLNGERVHHKGYTFSYKN